MEICELSHEQIIVSTLNKIHNQSKIDGVLQIKNVYLLNIIYNLINSCCLELSKDILDKLTNLYLCILNNSNEICHNLEIEKYKSKSINYFVQAESTDCNDFNSFAKIYYWQETNINRNNASVILDINSLNYFTNKLSDTEINFETGLDINYNFISKICFAITDTLITDNYKIYDVLNNDITHTFIKTFITSKKLMLFVSNNNYSYGLINIKIKKI